MIGQYRGKQLFAGRLFVGRLFGPAREAVIGGGAGKRAKRAPDNDQADEARLEFLRQDDESLLFALVAIVASRRLH